MAATPKAQEPSMEEILDSIRRIIADDDPSELEAVPTPPRPMAPARRVMNGYGPRPVAERRAAPPAGRRYGRETEAAATAFSDEAEDHAQPAAPVSVDAERPQAATRSEGLLAGPARVDGPEDEGRFGERNSRFRGNARAELGIREAMTPSPAAGVRAGWSADVSARSGSVERVPARPESAAADNNTADAGEVRAAAPRSASDDMRPSREPQARVAQALPPVRPQPVARSEAGAAGAAQAAAVGPKVEGGEPAAIRHAQPMHSAPRGPLPRKDLLSPAVDAAVAAAFKSLGDLVLPQQERTVEDLVKEILRPMLKEWLDQNLPAIVERLVRAEIERVTSSLR